MGLAYPGGTWALRELDLTLQPGEVVAVVGPSGSGKTTLLHLVSGLLAPSEGRLELAGRPAAGLSPEQRPVAMVFQGYALFPHLSARDNIGFGLRVRRTSRAERTERVQRAAATLGLSDLLERLPGELSGGERQRVALARALVRDPAVFCLDEPLSALDPLLRADARRELACLLRADGRCALLVTHDQGEAMTLGDRVLVLRGGRLEQVATPREIYDRPASPFVAAFVGAPPMSLLTGVDGVAGPLRAGRAPAGPCVLGVRPEHVRLGAADGAGALVLGVEDVGHELHVLLEPLPGQRLLARAEVGRAPAPGTRVPVHVDPTHVHAWPA